MNEWQVFGVLAAVAGLFATVGAPVLKLNGTIIKLQTVLDDLRSEFDRSRQQSRETHKRLWQKSDELEEKLSCHEGRILRLEEKEKKND
jgi:hypothetical protein